ncbi:hypothetical protein HYC85_003502 [Camellia sinensis]|uniref:Receptor-like serine/threonine-protein kinase n=1 Tax=Camellia sinensis TaxID=4442 RepID=A0A7J7HV54_CAMSI|nr:hypothetical protein HYC85_003502 [Camellia sinensis]
MLVIPSSSTTRSTLNSRSSLSVEKPNDILISPNGVFAAGFHPVGDNAFILAIWFAKSSSPTVVWTANRDQPVNGKASKLSLLKYGNLILTDAGQNTIWSTTTTTTSAAMVQLALLNTGNLVLNSSKSSILWQSFDSPTDTLLPLQMFTRYTTLVSSRSQTNHSSGFYKLLFDNGPEVSSIYWPDPQLMFWESGRTLFNSSKIAILDTSGNFVSSDSLKFKSADLGLGIQRRLTLDFDGNLRLYSLDEMTGNWTVTWQAMADPCRVHGLCGPNSVCSYGSGSGRGCSCLPGHKIKNQSDWSYGCELEYNLPDDDRKASFVSVDHMRSYGYDYQSYGNSTLESCKEFCLHTLICKGFVFIFESGVYKCNFKSQLRNGRHSPYVIGTLYVKLNVSEKSGVFSSNAVPVKEKKLNCSSLGKNTIQLDRVYKTNDGNKFLNFLVWFACAIGVVEMLCILLISFLVFKKPNNSGPETQGYFLAATKFKKFTYAEMKRATRGFSEEIGRGGHGVIYKGILPDHQIAAIKRLNEANEGEAEFLAEVSTIGRLNHMNLIEMWGYCAEGKHRLLVYEYMEHGSLDKNLCSNELDYDKRFNIAVGIAKGLAYLHEECLEWVLHCDVKPQNILLDTNYQPKVADFGLSKLLNRGSSQNSSFSKIRGTRGYMAPEWVFNLPITSKVDVYSYGIVVLEMITGRSPTGVRDAVEGEEVEGCERLETWVRKKMNGSEALWIEEIIDPVMMGGCERSKMENLVRVAVQCVEADTDARPTMREVVEMLFRHEDSHDTA